MKEMLYCSAMAVLVVIFILSFTIGSRKSTQEIKEIRYSVREGKVVTWNSDTLGKVIRILRPLSDSVSRYVDSSIVAKERGDTTEALIWKRIAQSYILKIDSIETKYELKELIKLHEEQQTRDKKRSRELELLTI